MNLFNVVPVVISIHFVGTRVCGFSEIKKERKYEMCGFVRSSLK